MPTTTHILRTALLEHPSSPRARAMREIEIRSDGSLYELAEAIVGAYDFDFDHCFGFFDRIDNWLSSEKKYELFADIPDTADESPDSASVKDTSVSAVWIAPGVRMLFLFDYGDEWMFTVELLRVEAVQPKVKYPRVLKSQGAAPEQYPQ